MVKYSFILGILLIISTVKAQNPDNNFKLDLSNPVLFSGSTLPNFYQRLWINGDFDTMLKFTASKSRKTFGDEALKEYFGQLEFGYTIKLKSRKYEKDETQTLNCETQINATRKVIRFSCLVENDTAKIIIRSLEGNQFP